jgi:prepilin-type N-terminal cleavage/methylation domain-containing protein
MSTIRTCKRCGAGFTLVEILVTIAIIGVLASIVLANVRAIPEKAEIAKGKSFNAHIDRVIGMSAISKWSLKGGTAADDFSGKNNGNVINATAIEGMDGQALSFNGSNSLVKFNDTLFSSDPSSFTVTLWAKPSRIPTSENAVLFYNTRNVEFMIGYGTDGKFFTSYKLDPSGWEGVAALKASPPNKWYHIAVEWSPTKVGLYINGTTAGTKVPAGSQFGTTPSGNPAFGAFVRPTGTRNYFAGTLDEISLYESSITQD